MTPEEELSRLGHHGLLGPSVDDLSKHSFWRTLGARSVRVFGALHHDALTALLPRSKGAVRGRILRLLGDEKGARKVLTPLRDALALAWLGELDVFSDPRRAIASLEKALSLDCPVPEAPLWLAAARLQLDDANGARAALDLYKGKEFIAGVLRFEEATLSRDHARALKEAELLLESDPGSPAGYEACARALEDLGREAEALKRIHEGRDVDVDVTGSFFYSAHFGLNWRRADGFLERLDKAIAERPKLAALYAERAEFLRRPEICRYDEARADYAKAVALEPGHAWLHAVLARAENNLGGGEAGLASFNRAVKLAPRAGWVRAWRGAVYARLGRVKEARADFDAAEKLMPWYSFTYAWRGALRNRLKDFKGALRDLDVAIRLEPTYTFSVYERFRARRGLKDWEGALVDLNAAFAADPKYVWDGDDKSLDAAIKARPSLGWLRAWRGRRRLESNQHALALADFDRALAASKNDPLILAWRGRARIAAGQTVSGIADLRTAARKRPSLWEAHQALADIHELRGEKDKALAAISAASKLAPTTVAFLTRKARLELELGRHAASLVTVEKALQLDASSHEARTLKGRGLLARGMSRDASGRIEDFRAALALAPELFSPEERRAVADLVK